MQRGATGGELAGSASREISIPDNILQGPLRDWLEWLRELRLFAGMPSVEAMGTAIKADKATVSRLFKGLTLSQGLAYRLAYHLAQLDKRPTRRSSVSDWDSFDALLRERFDAALSAASTARQPRDTRGQQRGSVSIEAANFTLPPMELPKQLFGREYTKAAVTLSVGMADSWARSPELMQLHGIAAAGDPIAYDYAQVPGDALTRLRYAQPHEPLDLFLAFFSGFTIRDAPEGFGLAVGEEGSLLDNPTNLLPRCRNAVVIFDNYQAPLIYAPGAMGFMSFTSSAEGPDRTLVILTDEVGDQVARRLVHVCKLLSDLPSGAPAAPTGLDLISAAVGWLEQGGQGYTCMDWQ
ncbi:hypothetical protein [Streptomyces albogriseolus]